jgi:MFS family permease
MQTMLKSFYNIDPNIANRYMSIPYFMSIFLAPISGYFIDVIGRRGLVLITSALFLLSSQLLFIIIPICPDQSCDYGIRIIAPMVLMGFFFILLITTAFPSIALVTDSRITTVGFGLCSSCYNLGKLQ